MSAYVSQRVTMAAQFVQGDSPKVRHCLVARGYTIVPASTGAELNGLVSDNTQKHGQEPRFDPCPLAPQQRQGRQIRVCACLSRDVGDWRA